MAEAATIPAAQEESEQPQEETASRGGAQASFLDPDVLLFALPFAIIIDILDVVLAIGVIVNLIIGGPLIIWMVWKTGQVEAGREQVQRVRQGPQERAAFRQRQQQQLAAKKVATRRALRRGLLFFVGGLIPIVSIFVLWTWAVVKTVQGK